MLCFIVFSKFIIPNHINQHVSGVWESSLEEPLSVALVGLRVAVGNAKSGAQGRLLPVRNTVSLRCEELLLNADSVLPVGVVLDPSVCVVMRELRGRSGPATEGETDRKKRDS